LGTALKSVRMRNCNTYNGSC